MIFFCQFRVLLKERVCSLVIKLFSPNIKYKVSSGGSGGAGGSSQAAPMQEKPSYAITSKLLRVVAVLIVQVLVLHNCVSLLAFWGVCLRQA